MKIMKNILKSMKYQFSLLTKSMQNSEKYVEITDKANFQPSEENNEKHIYISEKSKRNSEKTLKHVDFRFYNSEPGTAIRS